jgi:hypothetical protein
VFVTHPYIGTTTRPDKSRVSELGKRAGQGPISKKLPERRWTSSTGYPGNSR